MERPLGARLTWLLPATAAPGKTGDRLQVRAMYAWGKLRRAARHTEDRATCFARELERNKRLALPYYPPRTTKFM